MRIKTRAGQYVSIKHGSVTKQEKYTTKSETYYVIQLVDGRTMSITTPVVGVKVQTNEITSHLDG